MKGKVLKISAVLGLFFYTWTFMGLCDLAYASYSYSLGRLNKKSYPDGSSVQFTYTPTGKKASSLDKRGATSYAYDLRNRLTKLTHPDGKTINYSYDDISNLASISSFAGTISYVYENSGRLKEVKDGTGKTTTFSYDPAGNRTRMAYPNGTAVTYTYDINNRLTQLTHRNSISQVLASYAYTLGPIGNRTRIDESTGISRQYQYDPLYRLTNEQVNDPNNQQTYQTSYSYDAVGNRLNKTHTPKDKPVVSTDYTYNAADQLVTENGITYTYNLNGNLASKTDAGGTTTYAYDYEDRLIQVRAPGGEVSNYKYDAEGNRVEATTSAGTVRYLVDTNRSLAQVLAEYTSTGNLIASYIYADDLISMTRGGKTFYYHFDGLGSTRLLTDSTGVVTDTYDYDAFGNIIARTGTTENFFLFTGQQYDANIGFYYLRARYYQPSNGRFTSVDPWEGDPYAPMSLHKYLYAANDPVNRIDPSGMFDFSLKSLTESMPVQGILRSISTVSNKMVQEVIWLGFWAAANWQAILNVFQWVTTGITVAATGLEFVESTTKIWLNNKEPISAGDCARGTQIHKMTNMNLADNFPKIDDFRDGTATSIKTHNPANDTQLLQKIYGFVSDMEGIEDEWLRGRDAKRNRFEVGPGSINSIKTKQVLVAIPETKAAMTVNPALQRAIYQINRVSGVIVRVIPVKNWKVR